MQKWGDGYVLHLNGLRAIVTASRELDGRDWVHVSVSLQSRVPTYEELCIVKRDLIGNDRKAVHVWPSQSEHVNFHPNCLHLWSCLTEDPLPDFTRGNGII